MEYRSQRYPKESLHTNLMRVLLRWKECTVYVSTMRPRYGGISIFIKPDHKELLYIWFNFGKLHKVRAQEVYLSLRAATPGRV